MILTFLWSVLPLSHDWMRWNLFLALVPLILSFALFRLTSTRSSLWWILLLAFIAFLPNAPYILTDVIHFVDEIQQTDSLVINTLVIIPRYILFMLLGFGAYVLSLVNLGSYLTQQGLRRWVLGVEMGLHTLCAIGVKLGRFDRFNSWDLVVHPLKVVLGILQNFTDERSLTFIITSIAIISGSYWISKQIVLALVLRFQTLSAEGSKIEKNQKFSF